MRVDLLTREYPPDIYGGAGVHVTELVRALRADAEVVVRAFGEPRDEPDTASYRVPAELRDRVVMIGQVSEEDKVRFLHSVTVFCSPNTGGESFGIVTAEAMAAGRPIVASDIEAFREVLAGGQAGELFAVGDPGDLARAAGFLLDDEGRRRELSAAALAAVAHYDWSVVARDVLRVYETVILGRTRVAVSDDDGGFP